MGPGTRSWAADEPPVTATLGIAKSASVRQAVRDAVELSGGLDFIRDGQRVLIKPNQVGPQWHPVTTNPEVLYEVARMAGEAGAREIFVSDRCVGTFSDTTVVARMCRHYEAAMEAQTDLGQGVKVLSVPLDQAEPYLAPGSSTWRTIRHPRAEHFVDDGKPVGFQLAELLFQVDHVINVPCAKCHTQLWYTGAMKAFVGMSSIPTRQFFHGRSSSGLQKIPEMPGDLPYTSTEADIVLVSQFIAELNLGLAPALNIIDGTRPLHAGSHVAGESVKADIIIASRDRVAADVAEIALLRTVGGERRLHSISPWKHPLIRHARKLGLGVKRMDDLEVKHRGVDEIDTILSHMA
jgi:uncharacterized protein (DUF362 family)